MTKLGMIENFAKKVLTPALMTSPMVRTTMVAAGGATMIGALLTSCTPNYPPSIVGYVPPRNESVDWVKPNNNKI